MIKNGERYLVTTDNWFVAPDGQQYLSAWGRCEMLTTDNVFGFKPSRPSTNWFLKVGDDNRHVIIAGCQIHYAVRCESVPVRIIGTHKNNDSDRDHLLNRIYFAEKS